MEACGACGTIPARPSARFCDGCGAELTGGAGADAGPARKVVSVLFADLVGSTATQEQMDPETAWRWMEQVNETLRRSVLAHDGHLVKFTGDGVMAVFGVPRVREDDARRALSTAVAMHAAVAELDATDAVSLRIGVNTGEVVVRGTDDVVGDAVNVAARLCEAAGPGEVLVGEGTFRLVRLGAQLRALPPLAVKGKREPVHAFRLGALSSTPEGGSMSPFVGRADELARLLHLLDTSISTRRPHLAAIVASPGVGKSRLANELAVAARDRARVVEVRCDPAPSGAFAPIAAALRMAAALDDDATPATVVASLRALFDVDEPDRERIALVAASLLGVGEQCRPEEVFWAVRRLVENAARVRPQVFVFEDAHWAEPLLLDLIEHLVGWANDAPALILLTARPELRDLRPALLDGGRGEGALTIDLEGLSMLESTVLARTLTGGQELPQQLVERVAAASEGNPLFVGELVRMLVDDGAGEVDDVDSLEVPLSIHAVLAARIDRLRDDECAVLVAASVLGRTFSRGALGALVGDRLAAGLDEHLHALERKELIEPVDPSRNDESMCRFHHVLVRDAAYRRLLSEDRAALHEAAAEWLAGAAGDLPEQDDLIGYQLEQAHLVRQSLGAPSPTLGRAAAERLAAAGRRAMQADDLHGASGLLERALRCDGQRDETHAELLLDHCDALLALNEVGEAAGVVEQLAALGTGDPRLEAWVACFSAEIVTLRDPAHLSQATEHAARAAEQLARAGDARGEAKAHDVRAAALVRLGRFADSDAALDRAVEAARRARDGRRLRLALAGAPVVALWGPSPVTRASGRCLDVLRVLRASGGEPAAAARALWCQAVLEALQGRAVPARRLLGSARSSLEELGHSPGLLELDLAAGLVETLAGDVAAAERSLRQAHKGFHALGNDVDAAFSAALLARVRLALGDVDDALELVAESEHLVGDDLKAGIAWRGVHAESLALAGQVDAARALAAEAVELAGATDALLDNATALVSQAAVFATAGDHEAAVRAASAAIDAYLRKGAMRPAEQTARRFDLDLERFSAPSSSASARAFLEGDHPVVRFCAVWVPALLASDWDRCRELFAEDIVGLDHRPVIGGDPILGREATIEGNKGVIAVGVTSLHLRPLIVRGERTALMHAEYGGRMGGLEVLQLLALDDEDRLLRSEVFDLAQLEAAIRRLDEVTADDTAT